MFIGRAPWYGVDGASKKPFMIGITGTPPNDRTYLSIDRVHVGICDSSGGTASGKTTMCQKIIDSLGLPWYVELEYTYRVCCAD